jgi:quercetin dioxygenase-like cupin family protein
MIITGTTEAKTVAGPADWFTGSVWIESIADADDPSRLRASRVYFAPAARTAWHSHPVGQTLQILAGVARVQAVDEALQELGPGATVRFAPGELHWHGAGPTQPMVHLALQDAATDGSEADWGEHVTDAEYQGGGEAGTIVRTLLLEAAFDDAPTIDHVQVSRIELAPGQHTGAHRHPCHVVGTVLTGAIDVRVADGPATRLLAGDAFHEPPATVIGQFDNASSTSPAAFLACYLLPPGETELIELL